MNVLITGCTRGIGLQFARHYSNNGHRVFACCRNPNQAEQLINFAKLTNGRVSVHYADYNDISTLQALAYELRNESIDLLVSNAGTYGGDKFRFGSVDAQNWQNAFAVNTMAPLKLAEYFASHVASGQFRTMAFLSSKMASMADNTSGGSYIYRSSKAALNSVVKSLSIDLKPQGIKVAALHPGWVKTDMGGPNAEITAEESVDMMASILDKLELSDSGRFIDIDSSTIPW